MHGAHIELLVPDWLSFCTSMTSAAPLQRRCTGGKCCCILKGFKGFFTYGPTKVIPCKGRTSSEKSSQQGTRAVLFEVIILIGGEGPCLIPSTGKEQDVAVRIHTRTHQGKDHGQPLSRPVTDWPSARGSAAGQAVYLIRVAFPPSSTTKAVPWLNGIKQGDLAQLFATSRVQSPLVD